MILVLLLMGDVSVSGVNTANMWLETPGWATQFYNEAEVDVFTDDIRAGGRFLLDAENIRDTVKRTAVSQRYLSYDNGTVELWLGNYYRTPGQGLVLASFEDKAIQCDRNMDGGYLSWESNYLGAGVFAGQMLEEDHVTRTDWMYAGQVEVWPVDAVDVSAIYLRRDATRDADTLFGRAWEEWAEGDLTLRLWRFDLTAAAARRWRWGRESAEGWIGTDTLPRYGFTGSLSYSQTGIGVLLEGKMYNGLAGGINAPAACNPDGESINEGADELGFNLGLNLSPWDWLWFEGSYAFATDSNTGDPSSVERLGTEVRVDVAGQTFMPFFVMIDRELPGGTATSTPQNDMVETGISYETLIGPVSLHLKPYYRHMVEGGEAWHEPRGLIELGWRELLLSGGGVWELHDDAGNNKLWPWGSVRYNAYPFDLTLAYGLFKGEYICKNGVCFYELPFEGLKADLTIYF